MLILEQQRDLHQTVMFMSLVLVFVMLVQMIVFVTHGTLPTYTTIRRVVHMTKGVQHGGALCSEQHFHHRRHRKKQCHRRYGDAHGGKRHIKVKLVRNHE